VAYAVPLHLPGDGGWQHSNALAIRLGPGVCGGSGPSAMGEGIGVDDGGGSGTVLGGGRLAIRFGTTHDTGQFLALENGGGGRSGGGGGYGFSERDAAAAAHLAQGLHTTTPEPEADSAVAARRGLAGFYGLSIADVNDDSSEVSATPYSAQAGGLGGWVRATCCM